MSVSPKPAPIKQHGLEIFLLWHTNGKFWGNRSPKNSCRKGYLLRKYLYFDDYPENKEYSVDLSQILKDIEKNDWVSEIKESERWRNRWIEYIHVKKQNLLF